MKKDEKKVTLDPFERLHEHVHNLIIQHFTLKENLSSSEVSRKWNVNFVPALTFKFSLHKITDEFEKKEFDRIVSRSPHSYRSAKVKTTMETAKETYKILRILAPKIKSLEIKHLCRRQPGDEYSDMVDYLRSTAGTLIDVVIFYVPHPSVVNLIINELPLLTKIILIPSLRYDELPDTEGEQLDLKTNNKITNATVYTCFKKGEFRRILSALPNLKTLRVDLLTADLLEFVALHMKVLQMLIFAAADSDCRQRYEQLKRDNPLANRDIRLGLIDIFHNQ